MTNRALLIFTAGCLCASVAAPGFAAQPNDNPNTAGGAAKARSDLSAPKAAAACLTDLLAFNGKLDKGGYWLGGSGFGYGYPADGWGNGYGYSPGGYRPVLGGGYQNARPGYEIRALLSSANILARQGQQQACEDVLATANVIYNRYTADKQAGKAGPIDGSGWRQQQIAAAQPVADRTTSLRSDELIGTELRNQKDESLGSVDDLVMSPDTGKIAYVIVARGGLFGIDQNYVPVPWADIKASPNMNILVFDSTSAAMDGAPKVEHDQFLTPSQYTTTSQSVDNYWKTHLASN